MNLSFCSIQNHLLYMSILRMSLFLRTTLPHSTALLLHYHHQPFSGSNGYQMALLHSSLELAATSYHQQLQELRTWPVSCPSPMWHCQMQAPMCVKQQAMEQAPPVQPSSQSLVSNWQCILWVVRSSYITGDIAIKGVFVDCWWYSENRDSWRCAVLFIVVFFFSNQNHPH